MARPSLRQLLVTVLVALFAVVGIQPRLAAADGNLGPADPGATLDPEGLSAGITVGPPMPNEAGKSPSTARYLVLNQGRCVVDEVLLADGTTSEIWGTTWVTVLADANGDGTHAVVHVVCARNVPPPPPPPPQPTEIWSKIPLRQAAVGTS